MIGDLLHFPCYMRSAQKYLVLGLTLIVSISYAQRGKDGNRTVNTANAIVNEYTTLTANAFSGDASITVAASGLNTNSRFAGALASGDLIMIIQMQGATILGQPDAGVPTISDPNDSTWGSVVDYNNCGNYEFCEVSSVPNITTITVDCDLKNNYTIAGKVQIVRIPRYNTLTITAPGILSCQAWNGASGGILSVEVLGNTILNTGAKINVSGRGFRGGALFTASGGPVTTTIYSCVSLNVGTNKGEGIAGYDTDYTPYGGKFCRGAGANAGGGGNFWNCGGGGGANAGQIASWTGQGNPDNSVAAWTTAWSLEYTAFPSSTSSGGGRGGYSFSSSNQDATILGPGRPGFTNAWSGSFRYNLGGLGGRPLDYSTGKIFLAGGGGAGEQDNNQGGAGGAGGGIIYFTSYGTISGSGNDSIISNGNNGGNSINTGSNQGKDAAGGAGGGGTIILNSVGAVSGVAIKANGGIGGYQLRNTSAFFPLGEAEGPGGGGGGGYIAVSNGTPVQQALGGASGFTESPHLTEFLPNGATRGGAGLTSQPITIFTFSVADVTICSGNTATLTATFTGTVPGGTTVKWYSTLVGGISLGTGNPFTTPVLITTTTYYAETCPGNYRIPVIVTVNSGLTPTISGTTSICNGQSTTLTANGGTTYSWNTGATATAITVTPASTTTYTVTATTGGCTGATTVQVTVAAGLLPTISGTTSICNGQSTTLTANGGTTYSWNTGATATAITVTPASTTTYTVTANTGGCTGATTVQVTVAAGLLPTISGTTSICNGQSTTLTANGGTTYSWSTGATTAVITVTPVSTTTYTLTATTSGCTGSTTIDVTVAAGLSPTISGTTSICNGQSTTLTANGGTTYSWNTGATTTAITVTPASTTTYTLTATTSGCTGSITAEVIVTASLSPTISGTISICNGQSTTLTANGGTTYSWSTGATTAVITVTPASTTTYTLTATTSGCTGSITVEVTVNPTPVPTISGTTTICSGNSTTLTASGGGAYMWSAGGATTSSITITPSSSITYTLTVTNGTCSNTAVQTITVIPPVVADIAGNNSCLGSSAILTASGGGTYVWSTGETTTSIIVVPSVSTSYTITASVGSCSGTASYMVIVDTLPVVTISPDVTITFGSNITLNVSGGGIYNWSPSIGLSCSNCANPIASPAQTTQYCATVTGSGGCSDVKCVTVTVDIKCGEVFVPNAFSPNNDSENDLECVFGNCIETMTFVIFDRWGEKVFESSDPKQCWDGMYKGKVMNTAVFVYYLNATLINGENIKKKGNISLVR
ncbi:MAG: gliding motility-associated C-terminal domain-containing protein [Bacteroidota bacterium]